MLVMHQKSPNQAKDFINMVSVTLKGLWTVSDRIVDFQFFDKFDMSGPVIIFRFVNVEKLKIFAGPDL